MISHDVISLLAWISRFCLDCFRVCLDLFDVAWLVFDSALFSMFLGLLSSLLGVLAVAWIAFGLASVVLSGVSFLAFSLLLQQLVRFAPVLLVRRVLLLFALRSGP